MLRVAYLWCEPCWAKRLFVCEEPPYDEYACSCDVCGYQFGDAGYIVRERVVDLNEDREDEPPDHMLISEPQPALDREVLIAGMRELRAEAAEQIRDRHGASPTFTRGQIRLDQGLSAADPDMRAKLLNRPPLTGRG